MPLLTWGGTMVIFVDGDLAANGVSPSVSVSSKNLKLPGVDCFLSWSLVGLSNLIGGESKLLSSRGFSDSNSSSTIDIFIFVYSCPKTYALYTVLTSLTQRLHITDATFSPPCCSTMALSQFPPHTIFASIPPHNIPVYHSFSSLPSSILCTYIYKVFFIYINYLFTRSHFFSFLQLLNYSLWLILALII